MCTCVGVGVDVYMSEGGGGCVHEWGRGVDVYINGGECVGWGCMCT